MSPSPSAASLQRQLAYVGRHLWRDTSTNDAAGYVAEAVKSLSSRGNQVPHPSTSMQQSETNKSDTGIVSVEEPAASQVKQNLVLDHLLPYPKSWEPLHSTSMEMMVQSAFAALSLSPSSRSTGDAGNASSFGFGANITLTAERSINEVAARTQYIVVSVPVERIVEKHVEVEKFVQTFIEVEKIVERPVEVEKIVEKEKVVKVAVDQLNGEPVITATEFKRLVNENNASLANKLAVQYQEKIQSLEERLRSLTQDASRPCGKYNAGPSKHLSGPTSLPRPRSPYMIFCQDLFGDGALTSDQVRFAGERWSNLHTKEKRTYETRSENEMHQWQQCNK